MVLPACHLSSGSPGLESKGPAPIEQPTLETAGPLHSWRPVDALPGAASDADAVDALLARGHATLAYGEGCFEFTTSLEVGGACFLRLVEVGRAGATGSGRTPLVSAHDGYRIEQRVAPCRTALDAEVLYDLDPKALQALGRALLDDAARGLDGEERLS